VRVFGAVDLVEETGLAETEFKSAELAGKEIYDLSDVWWRNEDRVDAVDDAVCAEDVDRYQPAVEVDGGSLQCDPNGQALLVAEVLLGLVKGGDGVAVKDTASWVEVVGDMVQKNALQDLLGRLLAVVWDLVKLLVCRGEDGVVCLGSVEDLD